MAKRVELEIAIKNPEATESFFERTSRALEKLGKTGKSAFSSLQGEVGSLLKTGLGAALGVQAAEMVHVVTQGMRTTFSQATESAERYRTLSTQISIGTGRSFEETKKSIRDSANSIAESQQAVLSFSKSVESNTGYWLEGTKALDAYKDRALFLNKTLEEMAGEASQLSNLFNLRDEQKITSFFSTLNQQAEKLGVNAKTAALQFDQMAGSMARMTSANPEKLSAVSTAFLKAAGGNKEQATVLQQGFLGFLRPRLPYIEDEMRQSGKLKQGESILGKDGRIREDLFIPIIQSQQAYLKKHFGKKSWREQMRILGQGDVFGSAEAASGFLRLDTKAMEEAAKIKTSPFRSFLKRFLGTDDAKAKIEQNQKEERDQEGPGKVLLRIKDWLTPKGGGWSGVAADTGLKLGAGAAIAGVGKKVLSTVLQKGAGTAAQAVVKTATKAAPAAADFFALTAAKATGQTAVKTAFATSVLSKGLGRASGVLGFLLTPDEANSGERELIERNIERQKARKEAEKAYVAQFPQEEQKQREIQFRRTLSFADFLQGRKHYEEQASTRLGRFYQWRHNIEEPTLSSEEREEVKKLAPEDIKELASAFGEGMVNRVLKVQMIPVSQTPQGEQNPP